MTLYAVEARNEDETAGEGPFYFEAETSEQAIQKYRSWAHRMWSRANSGPTAPDRYESSFPVVTAEPT